ncbi:hypothetical protein SNEBB_009292 [Seison nebaliae]|nr:hypothetical protein SNEBB_009292 [Seison nebaliae]
MTKQATKGSPRNLDDNELCLRKKMICAGSAGCIGDFLTFPLDVAKVRLQIQGDSSAGIMNKQYRGLIGTLKTIYRQEGLVRGLYGGIAPGLQRQMCFSGVRIGAYDTVRDALRQIFKIESSIGIKQLAASSSLQKTSKMNKRNSSKIADFALRVTAGSTTGCLAVLMAQPTDVVKVRMQAQGVYLMSEEAKKNLYTSSLSAYKRIMREEGLRGLWKGTVPNICRNSIVNASEIVSYDMIKEMFIMRMNMKDTTSCHLISALCAGVITTVIASPVDVIKTRYMNAKVGIYKSLPDCAVQLFRQDGPAAFYKGLVPSFIRISLWNVIMFVSYEQIKRVVTTPKQQVTMAT